MECQVLLSCVKSSPITYYTALLWELQEKFTNFSHLLKCFVHIGFLTETDMHIYICTISQSKYIANSFRAYWI